MSPTVIVRFTLICLISLSHFLVGMSRCFAAVSFTGDFNAPFNRFLTPHFYNLDFDGDGAWELQFGGYTSNIAQVKYASVSVQSQTDGNAVAGLTASIPLSLGMAVSSTPEGFSQWESNTAGSYLLVVGGSSQIGSWKNSEDPLWDSFTGYMAVRFQEADGWHYGWVEIDILSNSGGFVKSYAWETTPNTPLQAGAVPEPGRAALVLAGFIVVTLFGRRRA